LKEVFPDISQKCGSESLRRTSDGRFPESAPCRPSPGHGTALKITAANGEDIPKPA
jgi:hypothetical protein